MSGPVVLNWRVTTRIWVTGLFRIKSMLKGLVHPKMKIMSFITHPHGVPHPEDLRSSSEHKLRYFCWNPMAQWGLYWQQDNLHFQMPRKLLKTYLNQFMWLQWFNLNIIKRQGYFLCIDFKTLLQSFTNLLFRISGSERVSNCQSHVISVNEASLRQKRFEISIVHMTLIHDPNHWFETKDSESFKASWISVLKSLESLDIVG